MLYDGNNKLQAMQAFGKVKWLIDKGKKFDIMEKKEQRSLKQNSYLHLILSYFAMETGNTLEYVKQNYFKIHCNPEVFCLKKEDPFIGTVTILKSSADLDTGEMTTCIERFRNWSSSEAGIYLPDPEEKEYMDEIQREVLKHKQWI
ncbi:MAG: hypothetical protein LBE91_19025 [Tannerella sp.]|jgi:hypothetical protein|nr:hypothetical protein [Tannerella sp.]